MALLFAFTLNSASLANVGTELEVQISEVNLYINSQMIHSLRSEYPLLSFNGITYFPLTYYYLYALGLQQSWNMEDGLSIVAEQHLVESLIREDLLPSGQVSHIPGAKVTVTIPTFNITVQGEQVDQQSKWPFLLFDSITYIPATWDNMVTILGLRYHFDDETSTLYLNSTAPSDEINKTQSSSFIEHIYVGEIGSDVQSYALDSERNLWSWGENTYGALGDGTMENRAEPKIILENVIAFNPSSWRLQAGCAAITDDGGYWVWGFTGANAALLGQEEGVISEPLRIADNVYRLTGNMQVVIKEDNSLWVWGDNTFNFLDEASSSLIKVMDNVSQVSCSSGGIMAVTLNGDLWRWGGFARNAHHEKIVEGIRSAYTDSSGRSYALDEKGILWHLTSSSGSEVSDKMMENVQFLYPNRMAIDRDGNLWSWGYTPAGDGTWTINDDPKFIMSGVKSANGNNTVIKSDKTMWRWNINYVYGAPSSELNINTRYITDQVREACDSEVHSLILKEDGTVWGWSWTVRHGYNGEWNATPSLAPTKILFTK